MLEHVVDQVDRSAAHILEQLEERTPALLASADLIDAFIEGHRRRRRRRRQRPSKRIMLSLDEWKSVSYSHAAAPRVLGERGWPIAPPIWRKSTR